VKAYLSKRAERSAERIAARWHKNADDPDVFAREFLEGVTLLETTQSPGAQCATKAHPGLKRILLRKSRCHVYFEINERKQRIQIISVWDARRGRPPKL
jgi:plasmid stabilization system protein ParE